MSWKSKTAAARMFLQQFRLPRALCMLVVDAVRKLHAILSTLPEGPMGLAHIARIRIGHLVQGQG